MTWTHCIHSHPACFQPQLQLTTYCDVLNKLFYTFSSWLRVYSKLQQQADTNIVVTAKPVQDYMANSVANGSFSKQIP